MGPLQSASCGTVTVCILWDCGTVTVCILWDCGTVTVCILWDCYSLHLVGPLQSASCGTVTVCILWDCYSLHLVGLLQSASCGTDSLHLVELLHLMLQSPSCACILQVFDWNTTEQGITNITYQCTIHEW